MKESDEMIKKIRAMKVRLEVIHDLEDLINKYEFYKHEFPCDISLEHEIYVKAHYEARIALLKKMIEAAQYAPFDLPETYVK